MSGPLEHKAIGNRELPRITTERFREMMEDLGEAAGWKKSDVLMHIDDIGVLSLKRKASGGIELQEQYLFYMLSSFAKQLKPEILMRRLSLQEPGSAKAAKE